MTLSHCWGPIYNQPLKLLKRNLTRFESSIPRSLLPRSFKDAIRVTKALGYRFLWIDSLCIIQDSPDDMTRELKIMSLIYQHSVLTIAAADTPSSHHGILYHRPVQHCAHVQIQGRNLGSSSGTLYLRPECGLERIINLRINSFHRNFLKIKHTQAGCVWADTYAFLAGPLSQRAWTPQERALSTRILHYTAQQMVFECESGIRSEALPCFKS